MGVIKYSIFDWEVLHGGGDFINPHNTSVKREKMHKFIRITKIRVTSK